jgi:hypothetical protein
MATIVVCLFMVSKWGVPNIFLYQTVGIKSAQNWRRKLVLAQSSSQLGNTTSPKSMTKAYWLSTRVVKNTFPVEKAK